MKKFLDKWNSISLVPQIAIGLVIGAILGITLPKQLAFISVFGSLFVGALKAVAPVLVLFLVMSALLQHKKGNKTNMKTIVFMYIVGTVLAGTTAVVASFIFKLKLALPETSGVDIDPPGGLAEVLQTLLNNIVSNPITAIMNANYIGILAWALLLGIALKHCAPGTKELVSDVSQALTSIVRWIIRFAPLGVMGLVFTSIAETGVEALLSYGMIILLLVGCMVFDALVVNPIIVFIATRRNPYPLVFRCLVDSGLTAFFTRSSAANIPVNMELCEKLELNKDTYSISIPLGATINMGGAAITISVLTLACVHTLNIEVSIAAALLLCIMSAVSACGASGVAGGSLLLIPLAASLFGIPADIAMQVVGVGFIVGVIQDSCETALNSSVDVLFTAAAEYRERRLEGK